MGTQSNSGDIAAAQERDRQNLIKGGLAQINSIFSGGTYGVNPATGFSRRNMGQLYDPSGFAIGTATTSNDPEFAYWLKTHPGVTKATTNRSALGNAFYHMGQVGAPGSQAVGAFGGLNPFNPFGFGESRKTYSPNDVRALYGKWLDRTGQLFTGTATSPGFGPDFYNKRTQDYINYALPQEQEQAKSAQDQLTFKLANQGLTGSTAGDTLNLSLLNEINRQATGVASTGVQQAQDLQRQIEQQRSNLVSQLEASADPASASQQALATAASYSAPSVFQPIGNLFGNWANTYLASQIPTTNPSLLPYLYGLGSTRTSSPSFMPSNTVQGGS
jgi:hypothetical protein